MSDTAGVIGQEDDCRMTQGRWERDQHVLGLVMKHDSDLTLKLEGKENEGVGGKGE